MCVIQLSLSFMNPPTFTKTQQHDLPDVCPSSDVSDCEDDGDEVKLGDNDSTLDIIRLGSLVMNVIPPVVISSGKSDVLDDNPNPLASIYEVVLADHPNPDSLPLVVGVVRV
ncbi:hypothetical protein J6590_087560 [Homalodisca vitripennis]|nr:hypothetical protein J6590_087560 [Homalodisca vitripennis]